MRVSRVLAGAAAVAAATTLAVVGPASASTHPLTTFNYAALGDSYSAGVGTDDYTSSSGSCDRSPEGYPSLWDASHSVSAFDFAACSGAKTGDVISGQLGGLSASTTLVSITIGGNDAGFTTVMEDCVLEGDSGCKTAVDNAEQYVRTTLPGLLDKTYAAIRSHAPNAHVVVLGYPEFYEVPGDCVVGLSDTSRTYIDQGADVLDTTIQTEVGKAGSNFTFVDARPYFAGHEICSSDRWINSVTYPVSDSYHPNAEGYRYGYLPALDSATG